MLTVADPLPDDLETAHQLIRELLETLGQQIHLNEKLQHQLEQLLRQRYGKKGERIDPAQLLLFAQEILRRPRPLPRPPRPRTRNQNQRRYRASPRRMATVASRCRRAYSASQSCTTCLLNNASAPTAALSGPVSAGKFGSNSNMCRRR